MLKARQNTLFVCFTLVLLLILQEALWRTIFPVPEVLNFNRIHYSQTQITPEMSV